MSADASSRTLASRCFSSCSRRRSGTRRSETRLRFPDGELGFSRCGRPVWQQPRQSLGHRLDEAGVLLAGEVLPRKEPEGGPERGVLGLVSELTVPRLPVDEGTRRLSQPEELLTELIPANTEILFLDLRERGALGVVIRVEAARLVPVPAPGRALDTVDVEHAKVVRKPVWLAAAWTLGLVRGQQPNANPYWRGAPSSLVSAGLTVS